MRLKKENEAIKDRIFKDIRDLSVEEKEDYYKPVRVGNFRSKRYIEYENNGDRNKALSLEEYLNKNRLYLKDIKTIFKKSDIWKIQLTITINYISSEDNDEEHVMYSKSDNIKIMINDEADEVMKELFQSLLSRYQIGLEILVKGSDFLYYKFYKIKPVHGGSCIYSSDLIKNKKSTVNLINKKDKCFQYVIKVVLNNEEIGKHPKRITKIMPFRNK